uniref:Peptidoglycan-binding LysM domain-containing protein n=1 Tax=Arabidopsis halleri subsp. halleri TaxID=81971 RepID=I0J3A5_ARAHH|nr:peptidoglycan-binding LysM domain-containing protein [Arabidopsis halleri subsp. halleri]
MKGRSSSIASEQAIFETIDNLWKFKGVFADYELQKLKARCKRMEKNHKAFHNKHYGFLSAPYSPKERIRKVFALKNGEKTSFGRCTVSRERETFWRKLDHRRDPLDLVHEKASNHMCERILMNNPSYETYPQGMMIAYNTGNIGFPPVARHITYFKLLAMCDGDSWQCVFEDQLLQQFVWEAFWVLSSLSPSRLLVCLGLRAGLGFLCVVRLSESFSFQWHLLARLSDLLEVLVLSLRRWNGFVLWRFSCEVVDFKVSSLSLACLVFFGFYELKFGIYRFFEVVVGLLVDELLLRRSKTPSTITSPSPPTPPIYQPNTISPLNSLYMALSCRDTLILIFQNLTVADLARASCVCKVWNSVATDDDLVVSAFTSPWRIKELVGRPASASFWRDNGIWKFAISHRISRGDSVTSLAVKYSVQVMDIKRLNNMMSDHGIYSRDRLLIPISNPEILANTMCYVELDKYAKREVAVLYLEGAPKREQPVLGMNQPSNLSADGKRRLIESLRRSMQVDDGTALYYLAIAEGDPRSALSEFSADLRWERQAGLN